MLLREISAIMGEIGAIIPFPDLVSNSREWLKAGWVDRPGAANPRRIACDSDGFRRLMGIDD
jgi:hypothetical protein